MKFTLDQVLPVASANVSFESFNLLLTNTGTVRCIKEAMWLVYALGCPWVGMAVSLALGH